MLALGGHPASSRNFQDAQASENDEDEDLLDDIADKAISIVNNPVLIIAYNSVDVLKAPDRVKVILALPIGITLPLCTVSPDGLIVEVSFKFPAELTDTVRIFGLDTHFNDPGMVAFRKMLSEMEGSDALTGKISLRMPFEVDVVPLEVSKPVHPQCTIVITLQSKNIGSSSFKLA